MPLLRLGDKTTISSLLILTILTFAYIPANADTRANADAAYAKGDYKTAIALLLPLAKEGSVSAQNALANMYANGMGVSQDMGEALKWWGLAAAKGDASAQMNLGMTYLNGAGVTKDYLEARRWFGLAAAQKNVLAWSNLGVIYTKGLGVPANLPLAFMWFSAAADNGNDGAIRDREFVEQKMTPAQKERGEELTRKCQDREYRSCGY